jgi:hypothetical protein
VDTRLFELYLLSHMHAAEDRIEAALATLGSSRPELASAVAEAAVVGFEAVPHSAELYYSVLGPPASVTEESGWHVGPSIWTGSCTTLRFHLPLWPGLDFAVCDHPNGYAWGPRFVRHAGQALPQLATALDLVPWGVLDVEVTQQFGPPTAEDSWSDWRQLRYRLRRSAAGRMTDLVLTFDFGLLQTVLPG